MKIITCASYHGTGSSALSDLLSEYDIVTSLGDYEISFLHTVDGIRDLEYHLVDNQNRHNSGRALKRFERLCKFLSGTFFIKRYEQFFNGNFFKETKIYINSLNEFKIKGHGFYDAYDRGMLFYNLNAIITRINHFFHIHLDLLPNEYFYFSHPNKDKFITHTKKYLSKLFSHANYNNSEYLMIDQLMPSSNIIDYMKYVDEELFVIVVDRDPRDVYLSNLYKWKECIVPYEVDKYCQWFDYSHNQGFKISNDHILYLNFEDLIYNYNSTVERIESFLGISSINHIHPFRKFNPKRSVVNTRMWEKYNNQPEIDYITEHLHKYIFDYSKIDFENIPGTTPLSIEPF